MTTVAFIGLGIMGSPMAVNLARAGFDVVGHNRTSGKAGPLLAAGGRESPTVEDAVAGADVVAVMVPDTPDVEVVMAGRSGVIASAMPGALVIDFSTIRPDATVGLHRRCAEAGLVMLDAPVSGGEVGAVEATLSIMVGGRDEDFERARPVLAAVGGTLVHVGPAGAGQTVKAANQIIVAGNIELLAEAIALIEASGVDAARALRVLGGGLAGSTVLQRKGEGMLAHSFEPGFRLELHHKDLGIALSAAREAGVVVPVGALVAQLVAAAVARGDGRLDHTALLKQVELLSGLGSSPGDGPTRART